MGKLEKCRKSAFSRANLKKLAAAPLGATAIRHLN
jgi:hypothetical protein